MFFVFSVLSIRSCYFAYTKLSKPGISGEVRKLILNRHVLTLIVCFVCNFYILYNVDWIYSDNDDTSMKKTAAISAACFKFMYFTQGYLYFIIRLTEPAIREIMYNQIVWLLKILTCR